jgi:hypothetical protein
MTKMCWIRCRLKLLATLVHGTRGRPIAGVVLLEGGKGEIRRPGFLVIGTGMGFGLGGLKMRLRIRALIRCCLEVLLVGMGMNW